MLKTICKPSDFRETNQTAFEQDIKQRAIPLSRVTLNQELATDETEFPDSVVESYLINFTSESQKFLINSLKDEDYFFENPDQWFHFNTNSDQEVSLTIELSNLCLCKQVSQRHFIQQSIPGNVSFTFKKIDNNTYEMIQAIGNNPATKALCSGNHDLDIQSDFFKKLLISARFQEATALLEATLLTKASDEKEQRILRECAKSVLKDVKQAAPTKTDDLELYTETIQATNDFLNNPQNPDAQNNFNNNWMKLANNDNRRAKLIAGSMLIMFGSAVFVGAVVAVGPAGIGLFGAVVAAKALKAFVLKHLVVSTVAAGATALGVEEWFRTSLFKSTKEALCDHMSTMRSHTPISG